jgi:hypothetical protein
VWCNILSGIGRRGRRFLYLIDFIKLFLEVASIFHYYNNKSVWNRLGLFTLTMPDIRPQLQPVALCAFCVQFSGETGK